MKRSRYSEEQIIRVLRAVIALWLGHESPETTYIYVDAKMALKEEILKKTASPKIKAGRYHPEDQLLSFLRSL